MTSISQASCSTRSSAGWLSGLAALALLGCSAERDHQLGFFSFSTAVSVLVYGEERSTAETVRSALQRHFDAIDRDWYPWRPGELQTINAAIADGLPVEVSPRLAAVIRRARDIETLSEGRFNAGIGRLSEAWGFDDIAAAPGGVPDAATIAALLDGPGLGSLRFDGDTIVAAHPQTLIDLGGIAKGAILEDSVRILAAHGIDNAIVNLGGDLTVVGDVRGRPASIGIRSPVDAAVVASLEIRAGETVVTSGNYERFVEIDGQRYAHVLDPRSGRPVTHTASVTVVHGDPLLADAAATALMVGGPDEFEALTTALGLRYALLLAASGDARLTPGMRERVNWLP